MLNRLRDVFRCFEHHDVHYVVIGGIAAVLHGVPRATFDLDLLIEATLSNAQRLLAALAEAGFVTAELTTPASILEHVITVFKDRVRIDVQTSTPGLIFQEAWSRRETMSYQGQGVGLPLGLRGLGEEAWEPRRGRRGARRTFPRKRPPCSEVPGPTYRAALMCGQCCACPLPEPDVRFGSTKPAKAMRAGVSSNRRVPFSLCLR